MSQTEHEPLEYLTEKQVSFKYLKDHEGVKIYGLEDNILSKPVSQISQDDIQRKGIIHLPNMYYPAISPDAPTEQKAAYFMLKELADKGAIPSSLPVLLYKDDGQTLDCVLYVGWGR